MPAVTVREATPSDIGAIHSIYAHHVLHGFGSFELEPPSQEEMAKRHHAVAEVAGTPFLVAESNAEVVGYAYAAPYKTRPGYRYTVEDSVYVSPSSYRFGAGRRLLEELVDRCTVAGFREMVAVIGDSGNTASIKLHEAVGFAHVGVLRNVGWKHERWLDTVIMQRAMAR